MDARRMLLACTAILLSASLCRAQQQSSDASRFTFTQVDLDLLEKSNQMDKEFQDKGLVLNDADTTRYLTKVGQAVLPKGEELQNVRWQFFILRDPTPNAFALPNGSIYIHSGLLAIAENEAQLAAVLAHEETHVIQRHGYIENRNSRKKMEAATIFAGIASVGTATGGVGGAASWMAEVTVPLFIVLSINGYSRELEQDADVRAVHALTDANYSSREMGILFNELQEEHDVDLSKKSFYQDHPKLKDRTVYVDKLSTSLQPSIDSATVASDRYLIETETAVRNDAELEIRAGKARTAAWTMERIVTRDDKMADNFSVLGDAYRGLGPRTPVPQAVEMTDKGKDEARKMLTKMTPQEYELALLKAPGGQRSLESNRQSAEKNYRRALDVSPDFAEAHRGLGFLYEEEHKPDQSKQEFKRYLDLWPSAADAPRIRRRIEAIEKQNGEASKPVTGN